MLNGLRSTATWNEAARVAQRALARTAHAVWPLVRKFNVTFERPSPSPRWAPGPLLKRRERTFPELGWPRETDSLCPRCVKEVRGQILSGERDLSLLIDGKPGEIRARIVEEGGKIRMIKDCPTHGRFDDVMAIDPAFLQRIERLYPGRDYLAPLTSLRNHGSSSVKYGRGSVLTVDLTNRCNMMCDPCFMDANQVGYVHELEWEEIKKILDDSLTIQPRRQMSVQFSGGEPTLSPFFMRSIEYAKKSGYFCVQTATNGVRFAQDADFARQAKSAGLRLAYLQFDGVTNEANSHRKVGNLFDVKLRAIENLHSNGVDIVPVVTIVNGVNNEQVGRIIEFALDNPKTINFLSFQPVSFTGRDEEVTPERRAAQRYTLSHLAHDVKNQTGIGEPVRDWFPISFMGSFTDWADVTHGAEKEFGQLTCGCHPNCGVGMAIMIDKETKEAVPVTQFLKAEQLAKDIAQVSDAGRGRFWSNFGMALSLVRNYDSFQSPTHFKLTDLLKKFDKTFGGTKKAESGAYGKTSGDRTMADIEKRRADRWNFLFIAGMWFQDLFNYDFRRTEMCIIPYATQQGEISFCAYNTGIGWRNIIEKMHMTATLTKWYEEHGRHEIFAGGKSVELDSTSHRLKLNEEAVRAGAQTDMEDMGIAKNAREEKLAAQKSKSKTPEELAKEAAHNAEMAKLYAQHVLKEQPTMQIQGLGGKKKTQEVQEVLHKPVV